jgi:hypothetical protein
VGHVVRRRCRFSHNKLTTAVWGVLREWWGSEKGRTHDTESLTAHHSLKRKRDGGANDLSPMFNYHIELATG